MIKDDTHKTTPLLYVVMVGNTEIVCLLVKYKVNVKATDTFKSTSLYLGTLWDHTQIVEVLVQVKVDVDEQDGVGYTVHSYSTAP